jgi:YD repeat-containing protein
VGYSLTMFNDDNQPKFQTNPLGGVTQTAYNSGGQPYCAVSAFNYNLGTTCPTSPPTSAPTGTVEGYTTTIYDSEGRVASTTDSIGDTTASTYDAAGNVIASTTTPAVTTHDPALTTEYQFNADNEQVATCTDPDGVALDSAGSCGQAAIEALSCATSTFCVAVDNNDNAIDYLLHGG